MCSTTAATLGDGEAVASANLADKLRMLGNYGSRKKYWNAVKGVNSRLDPLQAAVLTVKLGALDAWNVRRAVIAAAISMASRMRASARPSCPIGPRPRGICSSSEARCVRPPPRRGRGRDHHPLSCPPHLQEAYRELDLKRGSLPIAEHLADEVLSLPIGPHLVGADVERVVAAVRDF